MYIFFKNVYLKLIVKVLISEYIIDLLKYLCLYYFPSPILVVVYNITHNSFQFYEL